MQVLLKVLSGNHEGKAIPIKDEKFFIGRSDSCQLRPKSESISRKHCVIVQKDGRVLLLDLKSRNGTFINEKQVSSDKAKILKSGDRLRCGQLEFEVVIEIGIASSKKPEVQSIKDAAERITEQSNTLDSRESFDISAWISEADQIDRTAPKQPEPLETRQLNMQDTTRLESTQHDEQIVEEPSQTVSEKEKEPESAETSKKKFEKKPPIKLPKMVSGPSTVNTKDAATETLKRYFGGR
jgi:predicted component of type VI protein secretion system